MSPSIIFWVQFVDVVQWSVPVGAERMSHCTVMNQHDDLRLYKQEPHQLF